MNTIVQTNINCNVVMILDILLQNSGRCIGDKNVCNSNPSNILKSSPKTSGYLLKKRKSSLKIFIFLLEFNNGYPTLVLPTLQ